MTDDPFAQPPRAPDPSALSWTLVGPPDDEFEAPDRSEIFKTTRKRLEEALEQQWRRLQAALARDNTDRANFHPLTKHFFVKALAQHLLRTELELELDRLSIPNGPYEKNQ